MWPTPPRAQYFRDGDNSRIGWVVTALVIVAVLALFWNSSDSTNMASHDAPELQTTGQGNPAPAGPTIPNPPH